MTADTPPLRTAGSLTGRSYEDMFHDIAADLATLHALITASPAMEPPPDTSWVTTAAARPPLWGGRASRDGRRDLTAAVQAGQAAVRTVEDPALIADAHAVSERPPAPARHDPDMWARVYDTVNAPDDHMRSPYGRALAVLDAAHPDGSKTAAARYRHAEETARDFDDALDLLQDIRRAIDTHAAGPWLDTELRDRLNAATTPTRALHNNDDGDTAETPGTCPTCHRTFPNLPGHTCGTTPDPTDNERK